MFKNTFNIVSVNNQLPIAILTLQLNHRNNTFYKALNPKYIKSRKLLCYS